MQSRLNRSILYLFLILMAIICFTPFYLMIINATRSTGDILAGFSFFPGNKIVENFVEMQKRVDAISALGNSFFIAILSTLLTCYFSAMTAYGFCMYDFKLKKILFSIVLVIMMVPPQLSIIGFYKFMKEAGLLNSYIPLIIPSIATATAVFFIRQYTLSALPKSLIESARIDGAGEFRIFNQIGIPIISPAVFTMGITAFVSSWNNYMSPLILLTQPRKFTLPLIIRTLSSDVQDPHAGATYLCIALSIIPIMIIFSIFSRYIIDGLSAGGVKE